VKRIQSQNEFEHHVKVYYLPERDYVMVWYLLSQIRLSVVCNVRAHCALLSQLDFWHCFYAILYPSHPLTSVQNFTEIVPCRGTLLSGLKTQEV